MEAQQKSWGKLVKESAGLLCLHYYMHSIVVAGNLILCAALGVASCWLSDSLK